jgi:tetratricopeptide (TPR) repeat protein
VPAALVFAVAVLTYADTLRSGFLLDDLYMVVENPAVRRLSDVPRLFVETPPGVINRNYYRPVDLASLAIDHALYGENPLGYHLTNVLLHALASWLAYLVLLRILGGRGPALAGALLFAVHPVHGEVVYLVNYRATALATVFFFLALWMHAGEGKSRVREALRRALVGVCAFLSMASKEEGAVLPLVLLLYDLCFRPPRRVGQAAARYGPAFAALAVSLIARAVLCEPSSISYFGDKPWGTVLRTEAVVQAVAVRLLFVPTDLAGTYGPDAIADSTSLADPAFWGAALLLAALLAAAVFAWKRSRPIAFAILFHFLALAPMAQLIRLPVLFGERFLYLASLGWCIAAAVGVRALAARRRTVAIALTAAVTVLFGTLSFLRAADWRDELTFWQATARDRPESVQARYSLAYTLARLGRYGEALPHYDFAAARAPDSADGRLIHWERATCYLRLGRLSEAGEAALRWLRLHPDDPVFLRLRAAAQKPREMPANTAGSTGRSPREPSR